MTELEKWENSLKERNLIKDFLDFAYEKHHLELYMPMGLPCNYDDFGWPLHSCNEDEILDDYFQIDQQKLEEERRALLEKQKALIGE